MRVTVGVLLYGDYPDLASRCLGSLTPYVDQCELRIALNAVSAATSAVVDKWLAAVPQQHILLFESSANRHKYPMMREMLHLHERVTSEYFMWFDDDSYVTSPTLLTDVERVMQDADMAGHLWYVHLRGRQWDWIQDQPWYTGCPRPDRIQFATGGWWTIRTSVLYEHDWPTAAIDHRGGDVMLGELCRQQHLRLVDWHAGVRVNADQAGQDGRSPRRGFDQPPIGVDYVRPPAVTAFRNLVEAKQ